MADTISIVIPNHNGSATIAQCLEAALATDYPDYEIIVVDDCSTDDSVDIIKRYPCRLVRLAVHSGASRARNAGAAVARGNVLFFTDADCLLHKDTLSIAWQALKSSAPGTIIGGTYTRIPSDNTFFSRFQSVFIHHSETRHSDNPDYVATHAMIIDAGIFRFNSGFAEGFLPILEDVEFSHRLRRRGYKLLVDPSIQVSHIFNFSLLKSLRNALVKSRYWTLYSIQNRDLLSDSGTASLELKTNVATFLLVAAMSLSYVLAPVPLLLAMIPLAIGVDLIVNRRLLHAFYRADGWVFLGAATSYYMLVYPLAVGLGAATGALDYVGSCFRRRANT